MFPLSRGGSLSCSQGKSDVLSGRVEGATSQSRPADRSSEEITAPTSRLALELGHGRHHLSRLPGGLTSIEHGRKPGRRRHTGRPRPRAPRPVSSPDPQEGGLPRRACAEAARTHLLQRVPRDRLEGLLHVDGLLGTGLKVGNVVFAVAPGLCPLRGHLEEGGGLSVL